MTDFFADLERQLVEATPRRTGRLRRARRRLVVLSTILLALVVGGAGLATVIGDRDGGSSARSGPSTPAPAATATTTSPAISPEVQRRAASTVHVLNGTTIPGLARAVANRLQDAKFTIGNVTNAPVQDRSRTVIEFVAGNRPKAQAVARAIGVSRDAIRPLSHASKRIAGEQATVIVTVGADQNTAPIP